MLWRWPDGPARAIASSPAWGGQCTSVVVVQLIPAGLPNNTGAQLREGGDRDNRCQRHYCTGSVPINRPYWMARGFYRRKTSTYKLSGTSIRRVASRYASGMIRGLHIYGRSG